MLLTNPTPVALLDQQAKSAPNSAGRRLRRPSRRRPRCARRDTTHPRTALPRSRHRAGTPPGIWRRSIKRSGGRWAECAISTSRSASSAASRDTRRRRRLPWCACARTTRGIVSPPCGGSSRRSSSSTSTPCSAVLPLATLPGRAAASCARAWRDHLRQQLVERATTAAERIAHATGVYFPNRAHHARIAVKKLRYAAEISQATGASNLKGAIKSLRKGQEVLGEIHDRASLSDTLNSLSRSRPRQQPITSR